MGQKFLEFLHPSSKLARVIRQVDQRATAKSRKPREDLQKKPGLIELEPGVRTRARLLRPAELRPSPPPILGEKGTHESSHRKGPKKPRSAKQKAATAKNFKKMMAHARSRR